MLAGIKESQLKGENNTGMLGDIYSASGWGWTPGGVGNDPYLSQIRELIYITTLKEQGVSNEKIEEMFYKDSLLGSGLSPIDRNAVIQQLDKGISTDAVISGGLAVILSKTMNNTGKGTTVPNSQEFKIADRVHGQLNDPRMGSLAGKLTEADLQKLANNPNATRVLDTRTGHINVIQEIDGKLIRITVPKDEMKIISVGPIRNNQVNNLINKGDFVPLDKGAK